MWLSCWLAAITRMTRSHNLLARTLSTLNFLVVFIFSGSYAIGLCKTQVNNLWLNLSLINYVHWTCLHCTFSAFQGPTCAIKDPLSIVTKQPKVVFSRVLLPIFYWLALEVIRWSWGSKIDWDTLNVSVSWVDQLPLRFNRWFSM